jgi:ABC-2 type transport system permease protein
MKILDIALKDMLGAYRSAFIITMTFVMPLLITGLFYFAFGNATNSNDLAATKVQLVNLDRPAGQPSGVAAGQSLASFLKDERLAKIIQVTDATDEASARAAVDNRQANLALIIPADFSQALMSGKTGVPVIIYKDPTLSLGPNIVKGLVTQFIDGFQGSRISASVTAQQLIQRGIGPDTAILQNAANQYAGWTSQTGPNAWLDLQLPQTTGQTAEKQTPIIGTIMAGMMLFFAFMTGAFTAETIVREDEQGTLARLFTTPTPRSQILAGKFLAVFFVLIIQLVVMVVASSFLFGINWGQPFTIVLVLLGTVIAAAGLGVLMMSFVRNTRQAGPVVGGTLAVMGMLGGLFTVGVQNLPAFYEYMNLATPQGWALRGWNVALAGDNAGAALVPLLVLLGMGTALFTAGVFLFRRRYA